MRKSEASKERKRVYARDRSRESYRQDPAAAREATRRWREKHRLVLRERRTIKLYGLSFAARDALLAGQGGGCAICHATAPGGNRGWNIDHDHQTGRVRGLLCIRCNTLLGRLGDTAERIAETAARCLEYVR